MNKVRLLKLAEELERCSRGRVLTIPGDGKAVFDLSVVAIGEIRGEAAIDHPCGSACCAMGFAGSHPWFRRRGLRWSPLPNDWTLTPFSINGKDAGDFAEAGALFFGLNSRDATWLFTPLAGCETPKQYAKRIRKFVADNES